MNNQAQPTSKTTLRDRISANVPAPGQIWPGQGGVYVGIMRDGDNYWHLIMATGVSGVTSAHWGEYGIEIPGEVSRRDGLYNTQLILAADPANKIATYVAQLEIDGHKDFYWPAQCENNLIFINAPDHVGTGWHWSSTQYSARLAWIQYFDGGYQDSSHKDTTYAARAVRRLPI
ncbi:MAG: DUF1566 domain-containing protein [Pseudomonadota bacterium]